MVTKTIFGPTDVEEGNLSDYSFSSGTQIAASTTGAISGTYSTRAGTAGVGYVGVDTTSATKIRDAGGRGTTIRVKGDYRPRATPNAAENLITLGGFGGLGRDTDGKLMVGTDADVPASCTKQATAVTNGTVYAIMVDFVLDGLGNVIMFRLWQDGVLQATHVGIASGGATPLQSWRVGNDAYAKLTFDEVFDSVEWVHIPAPN